MTGVIGSVWNFIKGIPGKILSFLGINSPPKWAIQAGKDILNGVGIGINRAKAALFKDTAADRCQASCGERARPRRGRCPTPRVPRELRPVPAGRLRLAARPPAAAHLAVEPGIRLEPVRVQRLIRRHRHPAGAAVHQDAAGGVAAVPGRPGQRGRPDRLGPGLHQVRLRQPGEAPWGHEVANNWYASGTNSAAPGWAVVGERGPEFLKLRGGEQIRPVQARASAGGGPVTVLLENRGVIGSEQEMRTWLTRQLNNLARTGHLAQGSIQGGSAGDPVHPGGSQRRDPRRRRPDPRPAGPRRRGLHRRPRGTCPGRR